MQLSMGAGSFPKKRRSLREIMQSYKYKIRPRAWEWGPLKVKIQELQGKSPMLLRAAGEGVNEIGLESGEPRWVGRIWKDLCGRMNKEIEECQRAAREPGADQSGWTETWQSAVGETKARNQLVSLGRPEWHFTGDRSHGLFFFPSHVAE